MIKFGPAGADYKFLESGYSRTVDMPIYLSEMGLDCFEYSFGKGVRITEPTAKSIGDAFAKLNIEISAHAPYYINFANPDELKIKSTYNFLLATLQALSYFNGKRCVVHPGSPLKQERSEAKKNMLKNFAEFIPLIHENGYDDKLICVETMGKLNQMGSIDDVIDVCKIDKAFIPCVDFGHINARKQGILAQKDDYRRVIERFFDALDDSKVINMHIHFSKIEYGASGEIRHLTFEDEIFGPCFEPLAELLFEYKMTPYIICESAGTQSIDALDMKNIYNKLL